MRERVATHVESKWHWWLLALISACWTTALLVPACGSLPEVSQDDQQRALAALRCFEQSQEAPPAPKQALDPSPYLDAGAAPVRAMTWEQLVDGGAKPDGEAP